MAKAKEDLAAEWVDVSTLKPWSKNPRKQKPVKEVVESIKRFGFGAPIVARLSDREVIAGHTRLEAAKQLGLDRVPVRFLDLDENEAHILAIADNRLTEISTWDVDGLRAALDFDVASIPGFSDEELQALTRKAEEQIAQANAKVQSSPTREPESDDEDAEPIQYDPRPPKQNTTFEGVPFSFGALEAVVSQEVYDSFESAVAEHGTVEATLKWIG